MTRGVKSTWRETLKDRVFLWLLDGLLEAAAGPVRAGEVLAELIVPARAGNNMW